MEATEKVVPFIPSTNGHASATDAGGDASYTETFAWRPEGEGKAPIKMEVRPYVFKQSDLQAVDTAAEEAEAARALLSEKRSALVKRQIELKAELYVDVEIDGLSEDESSIPPKLAKIDQLLAGVDAELAAAPSAWQKRAELFIVPAVKSWPLDFMDEDGERKPLPLDAAMIAKHADSVLLAVLNRDLQRFLFRDRSKKKK